MNSERKRIQKEFVQKSLSQIVKNINDNGCWYFESFYDGRYLKEIHHYDEKLQKKVFFYLAKVFYEHFKEEEIKDGFYVLSTCKDKMCINPNHHIQGNMFDRWKILKNSGWKAKKLGRPSPETIAKISKAKKGRKVSEAEAARLRTLGLGHKHTPEARRRMSEASKGKGAGIAKPEEVRKKISLQLQGEKSPAAKLTEKDVLEIRKLQTRMSSFEVARMFDMSVSQIRHIWSRRYWRHV